MLFAAVVYAVCLGLDRLVGFSMVIPWRAFQLLDGPTLRAHPLESLCLLHSQPPGLNLLLAIVLRVADACGVPAEQVANVGFAALGLAGALAVAYLAVGLTGSRAVAMLAVLAMLADPGFHVFGHLFFYEFLDCVLVVLLLAATTRHLVTGSRTTVVAVAVIAAALALTRTLFHPLWAAAYCMLVIVLRGRIEPAPRQRLAHGALAAAVLLPALLAWPAKNLLVYGRFTMASMTAFNVARAVPGCQGIAFTATSTGSGAAAELGARAVARCGSSAEAVVLSPSKQDGSQNWNHVGFLAAGPELTRCATTWRLEHPVEWLAKAAGQYAMWTRPTFVHPYDGALLGPTDARWIAYATAWEDVAFPDLRPAVERVLPDFFLHREAMLRGRPVPYTLFGLVVLPAILALAAWQQIAHPRTLRSAVALAALLVVLWPMLAACLTDGQEGNRMRFSTTPALLVIAIGLVGELLARRTRA
jgi:hypothetical protein